MSDHPAVPHAGVRVVVLAAVSVWDGQVDTYDISYQWALSLGDFVGGELCVESAPGEVSVVETRGRAAKVDGRFPHWVLPWRGRERYSIIVYATRGEGTPKGAAVLAVA